MQPVATDVLLYRGLRLRVLSVCWSRSWAVQKWMNWLRCLLHVYLGGPKMGGPNPPQESAVSEVSSPLKSIGTFYCAWCTWIVAHRRMDRSFFNNGMIVQLLPPTAMLPTARCHIIFSSVKNPPTMWCSLLLKLLWAVLFWPVTAEWSPLLAQ